MPLVCDADVVVCEDASGSLQAVGPSWSAGCRLASVMSIRMMPDLIRSRVPTDRGCGSMSFWGLRCVDVEYAERPLAVGLPPRPYERGLVDRHCPGDFSVFYFDRCRYPPAGFPMESFAYEGSSRAADRRDLAPCRIWTPARPTSLPRDRPTAWKDDGGLANALLDPSMIVFVGRAMRQAPRDARIGVPVRLFATRLK